MSETPSALNSHTIEIPGLLLISNFITKEEEEQLMEMIDKVDWAQSQSGRRKQVCVLILVAYKFRIMAQK